MGLESRMVHYTQTELILNLKPKAGLVILMCGVSGSGKTTLSKKFETHGFKRLSIDEIVWEKFGRFGIDFQEQDYPQRLQEARAEMRERLIKLMSERTPAIVDSAFWNRAAREDFKALVTQHDCSWKLIYLKVNPGLLRSRLAERNLRFDANSPYPITDEILDKFLQSFEEPEEEGEIVVIP